MILKSTITLALAALLAGQAPAQQTMEAVLDLVGEGRPVQLPELDESIGTWEAEELAGFLEDARELEDAEETEVRTAAAKLLRDLRGFAGRTPAGDQAGGEASGEAVEASRMALLLVTELGDASDLVAAMPHAGVLFEAGSAGREARALVVEMVLETMDGDPNAVSGLRAAFRAAPEGALLPLIDGLRNRKQAGDASTAARLLGEQPKVDARLLNRLLAMVRRPGEALDEMDRGRVRSYLRHHDPDCRAGAARLAGRLSDFEAAPDLLDLLSDKEKNVATAAHQALQSITQLRFGLSPYRWRRWYERETQWWNQFGARLVESLPALPKGKRIAALNELCSRPLQRRRIAPAVEPLLANGDKETVMMALCVLESSRSMDSVPRIEALVNHPLAEVQTMAGNVLFSLTGRRPRRSAD